MQREIKRPNVTGIDGGELTDAALNVDAGSEVAVRDAHLEGIKINAEGSVALAGVDAGRLDVDLNGGTFAASSSFIENLRITGSGPVSLRGSEIEASFSLRPVLGMIRDSTEADPLQRFLDREVERMHAGEIKGGGTLALQISDALHADDAAARILAIFKLSDCKADPAALLSLQRFCENSGMHPGSAQPSPESAVLTLLHCMRDRNPWVRLAAVCAAEDNASIGIVSHELTQRALFDPEPQVVTGALEVISRNAGVEEQAETGRIVAERAGREAQRAKAAHLIGEETDSQMSLEQDWIIIREHALRMAVAGGDARSGA